MVEYLNKNNSIFPRGEDGNLLPIDVCLESIKNKPYIKIIPLTRGKFNQLINITDPESAKQQDDIVISEHCVYPKFTREEIKDLKPSIAAAIVNAIMAISVGKSQQELINTNNKQVIEDQEKNLKQVI